MRCLKSGSVLERAFQKTADQRYCGHTVFPSSTMKINAAEAVLQVHSVILEPRSGEHLSTPF